ncbi:GRAM domain-containing protein 2B isoform X3 [Lacerta agilis]|uniref:GRAM domain-containing protein 2B isoform X3 n=1 Tax=Lacerta agilis TaxID=80427 RepID=UPI0014192112|nr:GRAM domain-containing protein 2B isoform X3 [Lacerta agilis]
MVKKMHYLQDSDFHFKQPSRSHKSSDEPPPLSPTESTGSVFISSESENGTEEKKKSGKAYPGLSQTSPSDLECFEDQKKVITSRSKTVVDNTFLATDGKNISKPERKKSASNQFKANAHFHKLFLDVPIDEPLRKNFTCALQKEILYQGKLFISENWICFHSKVFGKDTKISIPVLSVTLIKKTKTALLVPNALVITTVSDRYIFVSFLSRDTAYKLLKSVCQHLEDVSVGNSPSLPSPENSFRANRPTTLPLDFNEDFSELDGIIQQRRQEMEESSSTGSQTPELEPFQAPPPRILGVLYRVNYQKFLTVNHILILYAILVCVLIFSTFYMRYKIYILEEQLGTMASFVDSHTHVYPIKEGLGSQLPLNIVGLSEELTANLIKLEKIQSNLQKLLEDGE